MNWSTGVLMFELGWCRVSSLALISVTIEDCLHEIPTTIRNGRTEIEKEIEGEGDEGRETEPRSNEC